MEELVRQRINEFLSYYKANPTQLSKGDSALQVRLSRQLSQGAAISCKTISFILETYPNISAEWLLRGTGSMIVSEKTEYADKLSDETGGYSSIRELQDRIVALEAENNVLREMVGLQKNKQREGKSA